MICSVPPKCSTTGLITGINIEVVEANGRRPIQHLLVPASSMVAVHPASWIIEALQRFQRHMKQLIPKLRAEYNVQHFLVRKKLQITDHAVQNIVLTYIPRLKRV